MYTRDFGTEETRKPIPDAYCGNLFSEESEAPVHSDKSFDGKGSSILNSLFGRGFDFKNLSIFKKGFGTEEILIIGIAAFLLFSKGGDKECAIILLLSLFL